MKDFSSFGGTANDCQFDNTPCLVAAYECARETGDIDLQFGPGVYSFNTQVPEFNSTLRLHGITQYHTNLRREYVEDDPRRGFIAFREVGEEDNRHDPSKTIRASAIKNTSVSAGPNSRGGMLVVATTDKLVTGWFHMSHVKLTHDNLGGSYERALHIDGRKNQKLGGQGFRDVHIDRVFAWAPPGFNPARALMAFLNCNSLLAEVWSSGIVFVSGEDALYGKTTNAIVTIQGCPVLVTNAVRLTTFGYADTLTYGPGAIKCRHYGGVGTYVNSSGSDTNVVV
jgi:hypothetical protein